MKPAHWDPIAGVDLETYARLSATLLKRGIVGAEVVPFCMAAGIDESSWTAARAGWSRRIATHEDVREAYSSLYRALSSANRAF